MSHLFSVEALNLTLQDLINNTELMGGKIVLRIRNFRQTGPVVKYGGPVETVDAALISSSLWIHADCMRLTISQRDRGDKAYAAFVSGIGVGTQPHASTTDGVEMLSL